MRGAAIIRNQDPHSGWSGAVPRLAPATAAASFAGARSPAATLSAATLGFFVITLDAVILNVALPDIRSDLGGGIKGLQWVIDGYTLVFAALLLSSGSLTDRIGAKRAFGAGLALFAAASGACALAPTLGALVLFRFIQGIAAAAMMPSSMALIGQAYPDPVGRTRAVAVWAMGAAVASASGPVLGGVMTMASWRWIFVVNLPACGLGLLLLARASRSKHHKVPFDWSGQIAGITAMASLTFGAIEAGDTGLADSRVLGALALAVTALVAFLYIELRTAHPMMPMDMFRSRTVGATIAIGFAFMVGFYGLPFVMSLFLQEQRGLSPLATGVAFLPMMLVGLVLTLVVPRITERVGARRVIVAGLVLMATGLSGIALLPTDASLMVIAALMLVVGLSGPTVAPPLFAVLLSSVPGSRAGTASGVLNTSRQIGGALAIAVFGTLLAGPSGFEVGMRTSLLLAAGLAAAAALIGHLGLRPPEH